MPTLSEISPIAGGINAPPTMPMINKEDAVFVWFPSPLMLKVKITGYMMEVSKPTIDNRNSDPYPFTSMAVITSRKAPPAEMTNIRDAAAFRSI